MSEHDDQADEAMANLLRAVEDPAAYWEERCARAEAILATVRNAVERHPEPCPTERDGGPITCGWKRAVADVRLALAAHSSAHSQPETHATHETHETP